MILGDSANAGATQFVIKELIISDGAGFNNYDATANCIANCQLYTRGGHCLVCNTGYLYDYNGGCVLTLSCNDDAIDPSIPKCRQTAQYCTDPLKLPPLCTSCVQNYTLVSGSCVPCPYKCTECNAAL